MGREVMLGEGRGLSSMKGPGQDPALEYGVRSYVLAPLFLRPHLYCHLLNFIYYLFMYLFIKERMKGERRETLM